MEDLKVTWNFLSNCWELWFRFSSENDQKSIGWTLAKTDTIFYGNVIKLKFIITKLESNKKMIFHWGIYHLMGGKVSKVAVWSWCPKFQRTSSQLLHCWNFPKQLIIRTSGRAFFLTSDISIFFYHASLSECRVIYKECGWL